MAAERGSDVTCWLFNPITQQVTPRPSHIFPPLAFNFLTTAKPTYAGFAVVKKLEANGGRGGRHGQGVLIRTLSSRGRGAFLWIHHLIFLFELCWSTLLRRFCTIFLGRLCSFHCLLFLDLSFYFLRLLSYFIVIHTCEFVNDSQVLFIKSLLCAPTPVSLSKFFR